ncbi:GatB/YqeY domain-containing protein [Clostridium sp. Cult1]|uniref:GatB/YqeY domain-containing protein n=1 Tax=Clostridium sp. Cult1 TaxID=2079002 RepID=UPI001F28BBC3|nr:GatB/YqeY domain-containing protein [Clostridium sp. Cult1]MCF6461797.1 aspartyl-tRNA amidotransferase [Clostridium sp. Cult1]
MTLKDRLMEDLKASMKNKNSIRKNTITMVRAAIKQIEVDQRTELEDEKILEIISKQLKEKKNAIEDFKKGERQDLVDLTQKEMEILLEYLPEQLTEEEIKEIVSKTIDEVNAKSMKDIGMVMKSVMPKVKGRADGNTVNKIVRGILK